MDEYNAPAHHAQSAHLMRSSNGEATPEVHRGAMDRLKVQIQADKADIERQGTIESHVGKLLEDTRSGRNDRRR